MICFTPLLFKKEFISSETRFGELSLSRVSTNPKSANTDLSSSTTLD